MTYADARQGEIQNGFKCIKPDSGKGWSTWKIDNSQEWTEQQRQEWKLRNQQRRQLQAREDEQRQRRSLAAVERHEQYTRLLSELPSLPDDRADLVRRCFTDDQIEQCGFKSIEPYQQLQSEFSTLLPGIGATGKQLIIAHGGYLCPLRNADGLIVACQVRLREIPTGESNRYRWLSGKGQTLHLFPEGCKPDGELPLAVFRPEGKPEGIALAEGTGPKPFLVSQRLNQIVIGAAGGQWASSPQLFKQTLERAALEVEGKSIKIFPDAGDILNPSVMSRWQKVIALLEEWGWSVAIGWWGQIDKTHPDIDELTDLTKIQYITPEEFLCQASQNQLKKKSCKDGLANRVEACTTGQTSTKSNTSKKQFDSLREIQNSEVVKSSELPAINPQRVESTSSTTKQSEQKQSEQWKNEIKRNWRNHRKLTGAIQTNSNYFDAPIPEKDTITLVKSGLGSGKTTWSKKVVEALRNDDVEGFFSFGYRNSLLIQLSKILGFYHIHDKENLRMWGEPGGGVALCVNSLLKFSPESFEYKTIIIDEACSVIKHLLHCPTVKNRDKILNLFAEAIRRCERVICLDGMMADWLANYLHEICPEKQIIKYENVFKAKKAKVDFLLGTISDGEEGGKIKVNDRSPILKVTLEESKIPAICSDSQALLEALDNLFSEKGLKTLRVDSKTIPENYVKEFLADCNAYIEQYRPDVLLYSPSAESGLDISIPGYFTEHFGLFFGVLGIDGIMQMMGRIRDAECPKFIWCKSFVSDEENLNATSLFAKDIEKTLEQSVFADINSLSLKNEDWLASVLEKIGDSLKKNVNNNRLSATIKAIDKTEKSNLREFLADALIEAGHDVTIYATESSSHGERVKNETDEVKHQNCEDIFKAKEIDLDKNKELAFDANWEQRCEVAKARLLERLPGIKDSDVWSPDFVFLTKYEDRNYIQKQELFYLFNNPELAKEESARNIHFMLKMGNGYIGTYNSRWAKINALHRIGLPEFLDSDDSEWSNNTPALVELCQKAKKFKDVLGYQGKVSNTQYLGRLLGLIGLKLKSRKVGKSERRYSLDRDVLNDSTRLQILNCIERKFTGKEKEAIDWQATLNEVNGVVDESVLKSAMEAIVADDPTRQANLFEQQQNVAINEIPKVAEVPKKLTIVDELIEAYQFIIDFSDNKFSDFCTVVEDYAAETIEKAIVLSPTAPMRKRLGRWWQQFLEATNEALGIKPLYELHPDF
jgi:hypothetical protein